MKRTPSIVLIMTVFVLVFICRSGYGAELHVPAPYPSIQGAIDASVNGDVVIVAIGNYQENIDFKGKAITVRSSEPENRTVVEATILDANGVGSVVTFISSEGRDSILKGFTITGGVGTYNDTLGEGIYWGAGVYCWMASPTIIHNIITGNLGGDNNAYGGGVGCYLSSVMIQNNIFKENSAFAGGGVLGIGGDFLIRNNICYDNLAGIGGGVVLIGGALTGNTLVGNSAPTGGNVYAQPIDESTPLLITNNIIAHAVEGVGLSWAGETQYDGILYNNIFDNAAGNYGDLPDQTGINGNISFDPLFVNAANHDYHLLSDSYCINAGDPAFVPLGVEYDIDGDLRVYAGVVDIGADEYTGILKPQAEAGNDQLVYVLGTLVTLDGSGSYPRNSDATGITQYRWFQLSGPEVVLSDETVVNPSFTMAVYGVYQFELIVNDGFNDSAPDTVTVNCSNVPPVADAGESQVFLEIPVSVTLNGSNSFDSNGDEITYLWQQTDGPVVALSDVTIVNPSFTIAGYGVYQFELIVNDGFNDSAPDTVTVNCSNVPPVADAGVDEFSVEIPASVTLDGRHSYDSNSDTITYLWQQIKGPEVMLNDATIVNPEFAPTVWGEYIFELIVNDGVYSSAADTVKVSIGDNHAPEAVLAAGDYLRYVASEAITLDGSESYDPDGSGPLNFLWQQVSGPLLIITNKNSAIPTISGFNQTNENQECVLQLVVSDQYFFESTPALVTILIVQDFGENTLRLLNPPFDTDKPTIVAFDGGNCNTGGSRRFNDAWEEKVNWITTAYEPPYGKYGDMLIVYLSAVAPDYQAPIQTMGFSTGNMPAIDVANRINSTYVDPRYAVNRVSFLDAACRNYTSSINTFINNPVAGEQCWIDNNIATASQYYGDTLNISFSGGSHSTPVYWYIYSMYQSAWPDGDMYNGGLSGGYYYSVAGPGKNLQLAADTSPYHFKWIDSNPDDHSNPDDLTFYDEANAPARLPEPVTLVGPADGGFVGADGAMLSCEVSQNVVGYQLLMGPDRYSMDIVVSDTASPPTEIITSFPYKKTYWTVKARDQYGSTIYADPICVIFGAALIANPFGPDTLVLLDYEIVSQQRISRTVFEYDFRLKVSNIVSEIAGNVTIKLKSAPQNITLVNDKVFFTALPFGEDRLSDDTFTIRIDQSTPVNTDDFVWEVTDEDPYLLGDVNKDFAVDVFDVQLLATHWLDALPAGSLVAHWDLNDAAGMKAKDLTGYHHGLLTHFPVDDSQWTSGQLGGGLTFDGVDDYVEIAGYKGVTGGQSRTVMAWIKTNTTGEIIGWGSLESGEKWIFRVQDNAGTAGAIRLQVSGGYIVGSTPVWDGQWHHVAAVLDNDNTPNVDEIQLYVDGQLETISAVKSQTINTADTSKVTIGAYFGAIAPRYFNGIIDEVRIYNRALSGEEIGLILTGSQLNSATDLNDDGFVNYLDWSIFHSYW